MEKFSTNEPVRVTGDFVLFMYLENGQNEAGAPVYKCTPVVKVQQGQVANVVFDHDFVSSASKVAGCIRIQTDTGKIGDIPKNKVVKIH